MAETIRIEIPVGVVDNTGSGTSSVTRNLTAMERAFERAAVFCREIQRRNPEIGFSASFGISQIVAIFTAPDMRPAAQ